jgi:hypothetical protein
MNYVSKIVLFSYQQRCSVSVLGEVVGCQYDFMHSCAWLHIGLTALIWKPLGLNACGVRLR